MSEEEKELNEAMESVDSEEQEKMLQQSETQGQSDLEEIITPAEVKSAGHFHNYRAAHPCP